MKLVVTRPDEDAGPLAAALQQRGHQPIVLPMMRIVARNDVIIPPRNYIALLATSANAIRTLGNPQAFHHFPLYVVGPQSLAAAISAGFTKTEAHGGDVAGLAAFITSTVQPASGPLLYLSGAETSGDLAGTLKISGFDVERVILYDAVPAETVDFKSLERADGVLLYSPRTARIWAGLVPEGIAKPMTHYCLSANVAKALPQPRRILVADSPNESAMLALLDQRA